MEIIADIYQFQTANQKDTYSKAFSDVRITIAPASNESIAMYENMPQGQTFTYSIENQVTGIKDQSKIIVTDGEFSGFPVNTEFYTVTAPKIANIGGVQYLTGLCYIKA